MRPLQRATNSICTSVSLVMDQGRQFCSSPPKRTPLHEEPRLLHANCQSQPLVAEPSRECCLEREGRNFAYEPTQKHRMKASP